MFGFPRSETREKTGVLEARQAIAEARHPRVPEPTVKSALEHLGPVHFATLGEDATALDALKIMAERDIAAVAVVSPAGLAGIFSERDFARNGLLGVRTAKDTPVVDLMNRSAASVAPGDSLRHCQALMNERQINHLAVLDQGRLIGLLSRDDLLAARIAYLENVFRETELDQKLLFLRGTYSC